MAEFDASAVGAANVEAVSVFKTPPAVLSESLFFLCAEQREVIEHLYGYVRNLNRGKRMGFMVHRKRISHSFVMSMLVRAVSSMAFLFPIILSLTRHAKREGELQANATCAC